jgi:hypothetical protein
VVDGVLAAVCAAIALPRRLTRLWGDLLGALRCGVARRGSCYSTWSRRHPREGMRDCDGGMGSVADCRFGWCG